MQTGSATHCHCISSGHFRSTGGFFLQLCGVWGEGGRGGGGEWRYVVCVGERGVCMCVCGMCEGREVHTCVLYVWGKERCVCDMCVGREVCTCVLCVRQERMMTSFL